MSTARPIIELLADAPLVDGHNDLLWELRVRHGYRLGEVDLAGGALDFHTDLPRLRQGGLGVQFWSLYVPSHWPAAAAVTATLEQADGLHALLEAHPDHLAAARTTDEVTQVVASGRIASVAAIEGGHSIGCSLGTLRAMYALGVRAMTLTHNDNTPWADSATDHPAHGGLTRFGREVVREMNRLGMLVDLSHVAATTMHQALDEADAPVIFSHSGARAVCSHPRNVPDDVLRRLPANGGVCMVTFAAGFVGEEAGRVWQARGLEHRRRAASHPDDPAMVERAMADFDKAHPMPRTTIAQVADHVDHIRAVAGIDHLGIGGDFDGVPFLPEGLQDVSGYPALFEELRRRGYGDDELHAIAGRNLLRAWRAVEQAASRLRAQRTPSSARIEDLDGTPSPS